jgi:hypothetical protein
MVGGQPIDQTGYLRLVILQSPLDHPDHGLLARTANDFGYRPEMVTA